MASNDQRSFGTSLSKDLYDPTEQVPQERTWPSRPPRSPVPVYDMASSRSTTPLLQSQTPVQVKPLEFSGVSRDCGSYVRTDWKEIDLQLGQACDPSLYLTAAILNLKDHLQNQRDEGLPSRTGWTPTPRSSTPSRRRGSDAVPPVFEMVGRGFSCFAGAEFPFSLMGEFCPSVGLGRLLKIHLRQVSSASRAPTPLPPSPRPVFFSPGSSGLSIQCPPHDLGVYVAVDSPGPLTAKVYGPELPQSPSSLTRSASLTPATPRQPIATPRESRHSPGPVVHSSPFHIYAKTPKHSYSVLTQGSPTISSALAGATSPPEEWCVSSHILEFWVSCNYYPIDPNNPSKITDNDKDSSQSITNLYALAMSRYYVSPFDAERRPTNRKASSAFQPLNSSTSFNMPLRSATPLTPSQQGMGATITFPRSASAVGTLIASRLVTLGVRQSVARTLQMSSPHRPVDSASPSSRHSLNHRRSSLSITSAPIDDPEESTAPAPFLPSARGFIPIDSVPSPIPPGTLSTTTTTSIDSTSFPQISRSDPFLIKPHFASRPTTSAIPLPSAQEEKVNKPSHGTQAEECDGIVFLDLSTRRPCDNDDGDGNADAASKSHGKNEDKPGHRVNPSNSDGSNPFVSTYGAYNSFNESVNERSSYQARGALRLDKVHVDDSDDMPSGPESTRAYTRLAMLSSQASPFPSGNIDVSGMGPQSNVQQSVNTTALLNELNNIGLQQGVSIINLANVEHPIHNHANKAPPSMSPTPEIALTTGTFVTKLSINTTSSITPTSVRASSPLESPVTPPNRHTAAHVTQSRSATKPVRPPKYSTTKTTRDPLAPLFDRPASCSNVSHLVTTCSAECDDDDRDDSGNASCESNDKDYDNDGDTPGHSAGEGDDDNDVDEDDDDDDELSIGLEGPGGNEDGDICDVTGPPILFTRHVQTIGLGSSTSVFAPRPVKPLDDLDPSTTPSPVLDELPSQLPTAANSMSTFSGEDDSRAVTRSVKDIPGHDSVFMTHSPSSESIQEPGGDRGEDIAEYNDRAINEDVFKGSHYKPVTRDFDVSSSSSTSASQDPLVPHHLPTHPSSSSSTPSTSAPLPAYTYTDVETTRAIASVCALPTLSTVSPPHLFVPSPSAEPTLPNPHQDREIIGPDIQKRPSVLGLRDTSRPCTSSPSLTTANALTESLIGPLPSFSMAPNPRPRASSCSPHANTASLPATGGSPLPPHPLPPLSPSSRPSPSPVFSRRRPPPPPLLRPGYLLRFSLHHALTVGQLDQVGPLLDPMNQYLWVGRGSFKSSTGEDVIATKQGYALGTLRRAASSGMASLRQSDANSSGNHRYNLSRRDPHSLEPSPIPSQERSIPAATTTTTSTTDGSAPYASFCGLPPQRLETTPLPRTASALGYDRHPFTMEQLLDPTSAIGASLRQCLARLPQPNDVVSPISDVVPTASASATPRSARSTHAQVSSLVSSLDSSPSVPASHESLQEQKIPSSISCAPSGLPADSIPSTQPQSSNPVPPPSPAARLFSRIVKVVSKLTTRRQSRNNNNNNNIDHDNQKDLPVFDRDATEGVYRPLRKDK